VTSPIQPPAARHAGRASNATLLALGVGVSVVASFTRPFTDGADATVAAVLAVALVVLLRQPALTPTMALLSRRRLDGPSTSWRRTPAWFGAIAVATGWELYCLFSLPRSSHPTISSMLDAVDGSHLGRGVAFAVWLVLGWYVVTR
jgi:hypothetical protein